MNGRSDRLPIVAFGASVALWLAMAGLEIAMANGHGPADPGVLILVTGLLACAFIGQLIVRRTGNVIGWLFLSFGFFGAIWAGSGEYLVYSIGYSSLPDHLPIAIAGNVAANLMVFSLALIPLLFPTGTLPSHRWRWVLWIWALALGLSSLWNIFRPGEIWGASDRVAHGVQSPFGAPTAVTTGLIDVATTLGLIAGFAGIASLVLRYRRASGEERQQIRWLAWVSAAVATLFALAVIVQLLATLLDLGWAAPASTAIFALGAILIVLGMPAAVAIAILKYRLFDIDVVVRKTVVIALLALFITVVYVGIVVGVGALLSDTLALQVLATAVVAIAFQPVRRWANHLANRLVYGKRANPYEVLARFADRIGDTYASEDVIGRIAHVIADGTGSERADVWLRLGDDLHLSGSWPAAEARSLPMEDDELPSLDGDRIAPVRHLGELLGAIAIAKPAGESLTPNEAELLDRLADQSGLVLSNVRLTADLEARLDQIARQAAELHASRQRIVAAQDEERRRLERNIHDGAQQHLVALAVKLRLARTVLERDPERGRTMLGEIGGEIAAARETIRALSLGIYPPLLEDEGIAAAIGAQFSRSDLPLRVDADGVTRHPIDIETAVYFCVLEALQNAAKYAEASQIDVRLREIDGVLAFEVRDDGHGFDPSLNGSGTGLAGMRDRLAVFGGSAAIRSARGTGTIVTGGVPLPAEASA